MKSKYRLLPKLLGLITLLSSVNPCFAHQNKNNTSAVLFAIGTTMTIGGSVALYNFLNIKQTDNPINDSVNKLVNKSVNKLNPDAIFSVADFLKNDDSMKLYIENELPKVTNMLKQQDALTILDAKADVMVIGDIHGTTEAIEYLIPETYKFLNENKKNSVIILGDFIDKHDNESKDDSLKAALWFFNLVKLFPDRVRILRGNHESVKYGLSKSLEKYWCKNLEDCMNELPIACTIFHNNKKYFAVHGGIDTRLEISKDYKKSNLKKIPLYSHGKEADNAIGSLEFQLMWNDFQYSGIPERKFCDKKTTLDFLNKYNYSAILRGHDAYINPVLYGVVIVVHSVMFARDNFDLHARIAFLTNDGIKMKYYSDNIVKNIREFK